MAYKMKTSPMYQTFGVAGIADAQGQITPGNTAQSMSVQPTAVPTVQNQLSIAPEPTAVKEYSAQVRVPAAASIIAPKPTTVKPARMQTFNPMAMKETPINPKAFGNSKAVNGVFGRANTGTFTRTVQSNEAPTMQLANPGMLQDGPELPPQGVQTSVTPTLGFENS
jgi:hypothetical protein